MDNLPVILAALACPVGMGAMMFFMMRPAAKQRSTASNPGAPDPAAQEISELRAEVAQLRAEQDVQDARSDRPAR